MLLREFVSGDPPLICKLIFRDDSTGYGYRVMDGERVVEHVLTRTTEFESAVAEKLAEGFVESARSLTRRVFVTATQFWIVMLDGHTMRTQFGNIRLNWQESSGHAKEKVFRDHDRAVAAYHKAIEVKLAEGYREMYVRKVSLPAASPDLKKFGKQGSR